MLNYFQRKLKYLKNPKLLFSTIAIKCLTKYGIYKYKYLHRKTYRNILKIIQNVEGLISPIEATYLYEIVIKNGKNPGLILDFGSYKGLSTCVLSQAASKIKKNVIAFESFKGLPPPSLYDDFKEGEYRASKEEFIDNIQRMGIPENIKLIEGDISKTLKEEIRTKRITNYSLAFIDVDLYTSTKDILFLLNDISRGGEIICLHDIHSPGIQTAIKEFMEIARNKTSLCLRHDVGLAELKFENKKQ